VRRAREGAPSWAANGRGRSGAHAAGICPVHADMCLKPACGRSEERLSIAVTDTANASGRGSSAGGGSDCGSQDQRPVLSASVAHASDSSPACHRPRSGPRNLRPDWEESRDEAAAPRPAFVARIMKFAGPRLRTVGLFRDDSSSELRRTVESIENTQDEFTFSPCDSNIVHEVSSSPSGRMHACDRPATAPPHPSGIIRTLTRSFHCARCASTRCASVFSLF